MNNLLSGSPVRRLARLLLALAAVLAGGACGMRAA